MRQLERQLGLVHVTCIASGALISSGLFVLPGMAHARAGPAVLISYLLAGVLATIGLLSVAELATAMPKAGGDYFFISRALGSGVGTVAGLLSWFSISLKAAFALVGMGALAEVVLPVPGRLVAALALFNSRRHVSPTRLTRPRTNSPGSSPTVNDRPAAFCVRESRFPISSSKRTTVIAC